jgi:hypothetical protein
MEPKNRIELLLSDGELELLQLLAEREGLSPADYLRLLLRQHAARPPELSRAFRHGTNPGEPGDLAHAFDSDGTPLKRR